MTRTIRGKLTISVILIVVVSILLTTAGITVVARQKRDSGSKTDFGFKCGQAV